MPGDPLFDTLFRPTTATPAIASAAPVITPGTRSRAGNAMNRTRSAILDGARRAVEISGTRITMAQVAAAAGVAKATLYNHFRTRESVLAALLEDEIEQLVRATQGLPLAEALRIAASGISEHPLRAALARLDPATLAGLARLDPISDGYVTASAALARVVGPCPPAVSDLLLRWLASHVLSPASSTAVAADVELLVAAVPVTPGHDGGAEVVSAQSA